MMMSDVLHIGQQSFIFGQVHKEDDSQQTFEEEALLYIPSENIRKKGELNVVGSCCSRMNYRDSFVSEENSYHSVSSPEIAEDEGEIITPIGYHGRTRPRRSKHDSMSSVDSNSSDKLFEDKCIDDELKKSTEPVRKGGKKRGRKPSQMNLEAKLERSRQSARECRARKKLRYQSLEDTIAEKEARVYSLRREVQKYVSWAKAVDEGTLPQDLAIFLQKAQGKSED